MSKLKAWSGRSAAVFGRPGGHEAGAEHRFPACWNSCALDYPKNHEILRLRFVRSSTVDPSGDASRPAVTCPSFAVNADSSKLVGGVAAKGSAPAAARSAASGIDLTSAGAATADTPRRRRKLRRVGIGGPKTQRAASTAARVRLKERMPETRKPPQVRRAAQYLAEVRNDIKMPASRAGAKWKSKVIPIFDVIYEFVHEFRVTFVPRAFAFRLIGTRGLAIGVRRARATGHPRFSRIVIVVCGMPVRRAHSAVDKL